MFRIQKKFSLIFVFIWCLAIGATSGNIGQGKTSVNKSIHKDTTNDVSVDRASTEHQRGPRLKYHPLPPAAVPGILSNFETPSVIKANKRHFLTELQYLKNRDQPMEGRMRRSRRSPIYFKPIPQIPSLMGRRNKRDLRRLRRDLGYEDDVMPDENRFTQSPYVLTRKPDYFFGQQTPRHTTPVGGRELDRLLQGLDILEQLAILTQAREVPPMASPPQHRPLHAPPSRFAPQPKLFVDDEISHNRPVRIEAAPIGWNNQNIQDSIMWVPEKRWSKSHAGEGLSMVPGFKRSVFREAARRQRAHRTLGKNTIASLAAILGAEVDPAENRIRRAAM